jgi:hypothetical protein
MTSRGRDKCDEDIRRINTGKMIPQQKNIDSQKEGNCLLLEGAFRTADFFVIAG